MAKRKIAFLSNITTDLIAAKLRKTFDIYTPSGYDAWIPEVLNQNSQLYSERCDAVVLLLDGTECRSWKSYEASQERINLWKQAIGILLNNVIDIPVFLSNIDVRYNRILSMSEVSFAINIENQWSNYIADEINNRNNAFLYDIKISITDMGRKRFYTDKMWYLGSMPYSRDGMVIICDGITQLVNRYYEPAKKIIVLDLDNTLWGGVIGEDGLAGIELSDHKEGQRYYDFQRQLLEMKKRGILLALNSKNNVEDAKKVFDKHPHSLLKWDDFVSKKVNWNNKAVNIKEMEIELGLTEGAFVFIDDNPVEREIVKGECPEVTVLDFPEDTTQLVTFAEYFYKEYFQQARVLAEDAQKTEMYLADEKRREEKQISLSLDEYIKKLEMEADIHEMTEVEIERVTQLCNKTNQFNVTTIRYTKKDIIAMSQDSSTHIFTVHTKDKYGEAGLVSVIILKVNENKGWIETFLMSCRVMGRKLENVIVNEILKYCSYYGIETVSAEYIATEKNTPVKNLYTDLGFAVIAESEERAIYAVDLKKWKSNDRKIYKNIVFSLG